MGFVREACDGQSTWGQLSSSTYISKIEEYVAIATVQEAVDQVYRNYSQYLRDLYLRRTTRSGEANQILTTSSGTEYQWFNMEDARQLWWTETSDGSLTAYIGTDLVEPDRRTRLAWPHIASNTTTNE